MVRLREFLNEPAHADWFAEYIEPHIRKHNLVLAAPFFLFGFLRDLRAMFAFAIAIPMTSWWLKERRLKGKRQ